MIYNSHRRAAGGTMPRHDANRSKALNEGPLRVFCPQWTFFI
jgi:hypothetical protein